MFCENKYRFKSPFVRFGMKYFGYIHVEKFFDLCKAEKGFTPKMVDSNYSCGFCRACKKGKGTKNFLVSAYAAHYIRKHGQFVTLTYNEESRPGQLKHSDFAKFRKDLLGYDGTLGTLFRMAGEYGEKKGREHFHVIFFNHRYDRALLERAWHDKGFITVSPLTKGRMKYASGYVDKAGYDPSSGKKPPYGRSSPNLPDGLDPEEILKMCETGRLSFDGQNFAVPELYRRRYKGLWDDRRLERAEYQKAHVKNDFTNFAVRGMMDERDLKMSLRKHKRV